MTQGTDSMSYPRKGYMAWGVAGPLSMTGYALGQHIMMEVVTSTNPRPLQGPRGTMAAALHLKKGVREPQAIGSCSQLLGTPHLTDLSLHREWSRPPLEVGAIETCLQAG